MASIHYFLRCFSWPPLKKVLVYHNNELALSCCLLRFCLCLMVVSSFLQVGLYARRIAALNFLWIGTVTPQNDAIQVQGDTFSSRPIIFLVSTLNSHHQKYGFLDSKWTQIVAAQQSVDFCPRAIFLFGGTFFFQNHPGTGGAIGTIGSGTVLGDPRKGVRSQDVPGLEGSAGRDQRWGDWDQWDIFHRSGYKWGIVYRGR